MRVLYQHRIHKSSVNFSCYQRVTGNGRQIFQEKKSPAILIAGVWVYCYKILNCI